MNRREFVSTSGAAAAALAGIPSGPASAAPPQRARMRLGCQSAPTSEQHLQYLARRALRYLQLRRGAVRDGHRDAAVSGRVEALHAERDSPREPYAPEPGGRRHTQ